LLMLALIYGVPYRKVKCNDFAVAFPWFGCCAVGYFPPAICHGTQQHFSTSAVWKPRHAKSSICKSHKDIIPNYWFNIFNFYIYIIEFLNINLKLR
jgi:hypothetical protein